MRPTTQARLKLLGVFMVFVLPLAAAYLLYYGLSYGGGDTTNGGELVTPAEPLPRMTWYDAQDAPVPGGKIFERKWTILQVAPAGCADACRQSLDETRQIRALLHRRAARVQRVLLVGAQQTVPTFEQQVDLAVYRTDTTALTALFGKHEATGDGVVYVVDPLGNWMLFYPPDGDGEALFKDLKHLLKLSHIG